jgi:glucosamine-6-phosphate deaminase
MPTPVHVYEDGERLGRAVAERIAVGIEAARTGGRRYLLGCPGGRTARSTYAALATMVGERRLPLDHLVVVMMDDYLEPVSGGGWRRVPAGAHHSCQRFGAQEIVAPLNAGTAAPVPAENLWLPDPSAPEEYDEQLAAAGGIDLFLLASGATDGHVAFNPPGSPVDSRTRVVELAEDTRRDNLGTFPGFGSLDEVPRHGVSVGIDTIASRSRELVMILLGAHKRDAFARIVGADDYDPSWPATVVHRGARAEIVADRAAVGVGM